MPQEPRLQMLPDSSMKLSGAHFRKVVRRIESIVPLAGHNITVNPKESGYEITTLAPIAGNGITVVKQDQGYKISSAVTFNVITLNVCSNGTPSTIVVYGP